VLIAIIRCARKLETFQDNKKMPILMNFLDDPEIQSLDHIKTPNLEENKELKKKLDVIESKLNKTTFIDTPTYEDDINIDTTKYEEQVKNTSFQFRKFVPYDIK